MQPVHRTHEQQQVSSTTSEEKIGEQEESNRVVNDTDQPIIPSPVVGFSLATPNAGPDQAPSYVNFSPLFTSISTPQQCNGIQQPIPINLTNNGMMRSPRLEALAALANNVANQPVTSIFSPQTFYSVPISKTPDYVQSNIDDPQTATPFTITPQQHELSVLERYLKYADEHRSDPDQKLTGKRKRTQEQPDDSSSQIWALPAQKNIAEEFQNELSQPAVILNKGSNENAASFSQRMTPKTKVPVGAGGSSCHQCKNRREANQLNFCRNRIRCESNPKRKICRKKFCDHCLVKFRYNQMVPRGNKDMSDWECPSCLGICVCAACKRKADPSLQRSDMSNRGFQGYPVAMTFPHSLLPDPSIISQSQSPSTL